MDTQTLSGVAGGVSGFADAFLAGMKEKREREAAQNKFAAYMELQREMMGNKTVTGQELLDYGLTMGIPAEQLKPLDLNKKYNITLGKAWVDNLNAQKITGVKEKGLGERAKIKAETPKAGKGPNLAFKPEVASAKALNDALVSAGYPVGTKLGAIKDQGKLDAISAAYLENMGGSIQAAGQQDFLEAVAPFKASTVPGTFWGSNTTIEAQPGYRAMPKAQGAAAPVAPAPSVAAVPPPVVAPVATPEPVGGDRKAIKDAYRKKLGLPPEP